MGGLLSLVVYVLLYNFSAAFCQNEPRVPKARLRSSVCHRAAQTGHQQGLIPGLHHRVQLLLERFPHRRSPRDRMSMAMLVKTPVLVFAPPGAYVLGKAERRARSSLRRLANGFNEHLALDSGSGC